ncbi:unnamed protein product [Tilletia controversa]|uniref:Uncharacterized protein n=3 Tax=Tilletia TaxID=13289 RepID=A0A8X7SX47_9BASI|nr:hypothetical protein CF336_g4979 [Tilletia laevis]KAE8194629.1 hypothetical protein CF328_g4681 [Tilletia controversa]KAE8258765.1 hypothetical protein A4X03_0g4289 [Tilletia caries]KAE8198791.1 hypothetical protein CF335_g4308 [Tilletia laevis]KAE8247895.1 hypothetical protein A4X06_0g4107 [Tilletia controversa]
MTRTGTSKRSAPKETPSAKNGNKAKSSTTKAASKAKDSTSSNKNNKTKAKAAAGASRRASKGRDEETRHRIDSRLKDLVSSSSKGSATTAPVRKSERQAKGASVAATTKAFDMLMK